MSATHRRFGADASYRWRELGRAPHGLKLPNGEIRIWRSELTAWLSSLSEGTP